MPYNIFSIKPIFLRFVQKPSQEKNVNRCRLQQMHSSSATTVQRQRSAIDVQRSRMAAERKKTQNLALYTNNSRYIVQL